VRIRSAEDLQRFLDQHYIKYSEFAALAGMNRSHLSSVLHGRYGMSRLTRIRVQRAAEEILANPPEVATGRTHAANRV
jgi:DNA-binding LacI/PurR family transcriptional regulator